MIHLAKANCRFCEHYRHDRKCRAFPDAIPDPLWNGENLHRKAYEGDQGFRYRRAFDELPPLPDHFYEQNNGGLA